MTINSKQKGKRGELEWVNFLKNKGLDAHRSQQFCGKAGDADVICEELKMFHFEVKHVEKLNLYAAMEQANSDAGEKKIPVVAHRRNREEWLVTMPADFWVNIVKDWVKRVKAEYKVKAK